MVIGAVIGAIIIAGIAAGAAIGTAKINKEASNYAARENYLATTEASEDGKLAQMEQARQQTQQENLRSKAMIKQELAYLQYSDKWTQEDRADDRRYGSTEGIFRDIDAIDYIEPDSSYDQFYA